MKKTIDVVGAVVLRDGAVMCVQRGPAGALAGKWEFPGGKIEPGESPREALVREIREELECIVEVQGHVETTAHEYEFAIIRLDTYFCELTAGEPRLSEHAAIRWLPPAALGTLDWAPADIPAVARIQRDLVRK